MDLYGHVKIRAPHCKQYRRYEYDSGVVSCCFNPALTAIEQTNLFPLSDSLKERLDLVVAKIEIPSCKWAMDPDQERQYVKQKIGESVQSLKTRKDIQYFSPYNYLKYHPYAEFLLEHAMCPDDFSFDQKIKLFEFFSKRAMNEIEEDYARKGSSSYQSISWKDAPLVVAREYGTLREWNEKRKSRILSTIEGYAEMESAVRNLDLYDWSPLAFIFGDNISPIVQLSKAALQAELKVSQETVMQEFRNFCSAVNDASQLGAMRSNVLSFNATLIGRFQFCATVRDTGGGAALASGVKDVVGGTASDIKDVALGVGTLAALPFMLLFGGKKK